MASGWRRDHTHRVTFTSRNRNVLSSAEDLEGARDRVVDQAFEHYMDWCRQLSTCESA